MKRPRVIGNNQQPERFYSGLSRQGLIEELTVTEQYISDNEISEELKFLYKRRYMKILDALKSKLENLEMTKLSEESGKRQYFQDR
jgi:hypothetical protein